MMKNSFLMYTDWLDMVEELDDADRGVLMLAVMRYQAGQELPEMGIGARVAFAQIKSQFKKDAEKYEEISRKRKEAGRSGGNAKAESVEQNVANVANASKCYQNEASSGKDKQSLHDNDNDNENENDKTLKDTPKPPEGAHADFADFNPDPIQNPPYRDIVDHLNARAGTKYQHTAEETRRLIRARMNNGFTLADFFAVIDKKAAEWKGTENEKYLRPQTLFGAKFESYLNQPVPTPHHGTSPPKNRFNNFAQREYDYRELEKKLLGGDTGDG